MEPGFLIFLSDNQFDYATLSITEGTENVQFPLSNLFLSTTTKKFRSTGNTVKIVVDLLQNRAIDIIAITGDATGQMGLTSLIAKTSLTTDFSMSDEIEIIPSSQHNIGYKSFVSRSHRFVELTIEGNGSYAELSNIFIGEKIALLQNGLSISSFKYQNIEKSTTKENDYGQQFTDVRNLQKSMSGNIDYCTKDEFEQLEDMFLYHRTFKPLWVIADPNDKAMNDGSKRLAMYGRLASIPSWSASGAVTYNTGITLKQVI